ncbi:MAG TPA: AlkA N-terminal domain-containing protein [Terriglobales bacterium]|nr:AlkA N-terminal domain-containing protein [Terriglobales bacterium]
MDKLPLDKKACYRAFMSHDPRFDGRLFVGVSSTGIYCRPVCRTKTPKEENCTFFTSAAAAQAAGYRPCLKCRPELAPGLAPIDGPANLARRAALMLEDDLLPEGGVEELAAALGVTGRHLRRVFAAEYGVPPVKYRETHRLLLAKSLLTDTDLPVTEVAYAAGFGSLRRFNAIFLRQCRMPPSALRKETRAQGGAGRDGVALYLGYRPPYRWEDILDFLAGRAIPGVESVSDGVYARTVALQSEKGLCRGWISVSHAEKKYALAVTASASLLPVLPKVLAGVRHLFDLRCDPAVIFERLSAMNDIRPGLFAPGTRVPGCFDAFEMAVRAILGQQVTVAAARTLAGRVAASLGAELETPIAGLTHTFPSPADICRLGDSPESVLGPLGVTGVRARAIAALAKGLTSGELDWSLGAAPEEQMKKLLKLPGFGPWTVQYVAMRALGWPDAMLETDYGVKKALSGLNPKEILTLAEDWRPWRSYATMGLWNSLKNGGQT